MVKGNKENYDIWISFNGINILTWTYCNTLVEQTYCNTLVEQTY